MNLMRKAMVYLGLIDNEDQYNVDNLYQETGLVDSNRQVNSMRKDIPINQQSYIASHIRNQAANRNAEVRTPVKENITPLDKMTSDQINRITTIHPRSYNDAKLIGESFRNNIPVIMNLTSMSEIEAKRLIDFSAGLVFGMHGTIERVTNKVFLLSPSYVEVVNDENPSQPFVEG